MKQELWSDQQTHGSRFEVVLKSEGRLVNQFCPKKRHFEVWGGGSLDMTFFNSFLLCQKLEIVGLSVSDNVLESFPGSDSTNAVIKHMPIPVASPADKDYHQN